eukprot:CAMPEP_0168179152 /NCGR_PEP_ID=MMETSP0139_2-20121125/9653_1 /TAXON_ID=44445 /ORGANISM="Pseudo-nitzschia australis, Strain 10249 10 AB" /LENGTH=367 /DNA_ID=CAMNT_0008098887 /DNA_START=83 /DNA_END=1186 /DNA_ORIENTATION=-
MKLMPKNTRALVVTITISIAMVMAMVPKTGVAAFAVNAQRTGTSSTLPPVYDSTPSEIFSTDKGRTPSLFTLDLRSLSTTTALSAAVPVQLLPGPFVAAAVIPTCIGLWRTGFAVSFGYGGAMLVSGVVQLAGSLRGPSEAMLPLKLHAAIYVFYGARLCGFLFHRQKKSLLGGMKRRDATLAERFKRLPIILGCSGLYYCMACCPMKILALDNPTTSVANAAALAIGFLGMLLAAVGDWYKSKIKARDGVNTLVTSGPFRYFRHPNYTGEMIGWTSLCLLTPALSCLGSSSNLRRMIPLLLSSIVGWAGIVFAVLGLDATAGLEKKQREKYGGTPEYEAWVKTSWSGPMAGKVDDDATANKGAVRN